MCWFPFIHLGGERHCALEHNTMYSAMSLHVMLCKITDYLNIQCPSGFLISHFPWGHPFSLIMTSVSPSFTGSSNFPSPGKFLLASPTPLPSAPGFNWKMRKAHCQYKLRNIQKGKEEKGEVCTPAQYSIERLGVFLIPLYVMIVHCRVT